jgi:hypothetical protein
MAAFKSLFHKKISLSVLPDEYYFSFKSFYKTLLIQGTFDMGAILQMARLSEKKTDDETHIYNIIQGFTILLRKLEQKEDDMVKNKTDKDLKITPYTYAFILAGLQFCIINHQLSEISEK